MTGACRPPPGLPEPSSLPRDAGCHYSKKLKTETWVVILQIIQIDRLFQHFIITICYTNWTRYALTGAGADGAAGAPGALRAAYRVWFNCCGRRLGFGLRWRCGPRWREYYKEGLNWDEIEKSKHDGSNFNSLIDSVTLLSQGGEYSSPFVQTIMGLVTAPLRYLSPATQHENAPRGIPTSVVSAWPFSPNGSSSKLLVYSKF